MQRRRFLCASLGLGAAAAAGWPMLQPAGPLRMHAAGDLAFGTVVTIKVMHHDARQAELALADALAAVRKVDTLMSVYRRGSEVHELNRNGRLDRPSPHLLAVLTEARRISALTEGAFDITVQPLWELARQGRGRAPALPLVGWRRMRADAACVTLCPGMQVTLNGIAQGYAVDLARAALQAHGIRHALIDTGEFSALGVAEGGRQWTLGVRDPRRDEGYAGVLQMDGRAVATSGDYAGAFTQDFSDHHIFDPVTGASPVQLAAVTVAAPSGILADGLSTAFMVMGAQRSLALAARMHNVDMVAIDKQGRRWHSPGLHLLATVAGGHLPGRRRGEMS